MKKRFAGQEKPLLIGVIKETTVKACAAAVRQAKLNGATAIDLHLSTLPREEVTPEKLRPIFECTDLPVMSLQYGFDYMGTHYPISHEARMEELLASVEAGAVCVDMQGHTFSQVDTRQTLDPENIPEGMSFVRKMPKEVSLDPQVIEQQKQMVRRFHEKGADVLISMHVGTYLNTEELIDLIRFVLERDVDIVKVVGVCDTKEDLADYFNAVITMQQEFPGKNLHYHCNGKYGALTRVMGPMLGSYLMFCNDGYTAASDLNQLHLETMVKVWDLLERQGVL